MGYVPSRLSYCYIIFSNPGEAKTAKLWLSIGVCRQVPTSFVGNKAYFEKYHPCYAVLSREIYCTELRKTIQTPSLHSSVKI